MCENAIEKTKHEISKQAYITYLDHMRLNESNVIKFLAIVVSAIGVFIYAANYAIKDGTNFTVLLSAAFFGNSILLWGILYTLAMSYTHRYLQILMTMYEIKYDLIRINMWKPSKWSKWKNEPWYRCKVATSPYQVHLIGYSFCILIIWIAYFILTLENGYKQIFNMKYDSYIIFFRNLSCEICIIFFCLSVSLATVYFATIYYRNKILDIVENEKENLEKLKRFEL